MQIACIADPIAILIAGQARVDGTQIASIADAVTVFVVLVGVRQLGTVIVLVANSVIVAIGIRIDENRRIDEDRCLEGEQLIAPGEQDDRNAKTHDVDVSTACVGVRLGITRRRSRESAIRAACLVVCTLQVARSRCGVAGGRVKPAAAEATFVRDRERSRGSHAIGMASPLL